MYKKMIKKTLLVLLLAFLCIPAIYSAGTDEVEARELQFTDPYKLLDLPYTAGLSFQDLSLELSFDFTTQVQTRFQYTETISTVEVDTAGMTEKRYLQETEAEMVFRQNGMGFADIIYNDFLSTMAKSIKDTDGNIQFRSRTDTGPITVTHAGYNPKGIYPYDTALNFIYSLQFPITNSEINTGSSITAAIGMPVLLLGKEIIAEGEMHITHSGYVDINGKRYAKLLSEISIDTNSIPRALDNEFSLAVSGYGVYYFNIKEKSYYYGHVQFDVSIEAAVLMPVLSKFRDPGQDVLKKTIDTRVTFRYEQID